MGGLSVFINFFLVGGKKALKIRFLERNFFFLSFLSLFLYSCGSLVSSLDGSWSSETVKVFITAKEKTFRFENITDPTQSFSEKIISVKKKAGNKIEIQLTNNREVTLKTFGGDTMFVYLEDGYLRLKKDTE